ncbi:hypothetical protein EC968_009720, partial [Mortierella alpina]
MATDELGSLAGLLRRNIGPRVKERSRQLLDEIRGALLGLSASCRKFAQAAHGQDIHSIQTAAAATRDEVNLAKATYTRAIQELERYDKIEPSMKTELEQSCVRYYELLFQATQQRAMSSILCRDLEKAYQDMDSVMQKVADAQVETEISGILRDSGMDEDLRAILDPTRGLCIVHWTGVYLEGPVMNERIGPRSNTSDKDRVTRIAKTAARMLRECCPGMYLPEPDLDLGILNRAAALELSHQHAQFYTTSLSSLMVEMKIDERDLNGDNAILQYMRLNESRPEAERWSFFSRLGLGDRFVKFSSDGLRRALLASSSPVRKVMEDILSTDEDVVFEFFFASTRHAK